jgi:hypothetical protein
VAATGINEIDRHRRTDIDDAHGAPPGYPMSPYGGGDAIDTKPPRLRIRCGHAPQVARRHHELRCHSNHAMGGGTQSPVQPFATYTGNDDAFHAARARQKLFCKVLRAPAGMGGGALLLQSAVREARPFHARIADIYQKDAQANGLTLTSPATNFRTP